MSLETELERLRQKADEKRKIEAEDDVVWWHRKMEPEPVVAAVWDAIQQQKLKQEILSNYSSESHPKKPKEAA